MIWSIIVTSIPLPILFLLFVWLLRLVERFWVELFDLCIFHVALMWHILHINRRPQTCYWMENSIVQQSKFFFSLHFLHLFNQCLYQEVGHVALFASAYVFIKNVHIQWIMLVIPFYIRFSGTYSLCPFSYQPQPSIFFLNSCDLENILGPSDMNY